MSGKAKRVAGSSPKSPQVPRPAKASGGADEPWSLARGPAAHVKPCHQDEAHAPRRSALDLGFPSWCLGDLCAADVKEYLRHSDTILIPKASLEQHGAHLPLFCDSITANEVAKRAGRKAGIVGRLRQHRTRHDHGSKQEQWNQFHENPSPRLKEKTPESRKRGSTRAT